jgi:hypothetical protein
VTTFAAGQVSKYTIVPASTELGWRSLFGSGFIEDTWKATQRLELRAGLRIESSNGWNESQGRASNYQFTNGVINTTPTVGGAALTDNRARFMPEPRVGLAFDPFGNGKTVIRASFGLHRAILDALNYRLDQTAPFNTAFAYSNATVANLPALSLSSATGGLVSPSNVQPNLETPTVLAWTLKVEREILPNTTLSVGYVGSHGYHQILSEDQNTPPWVYCPAPSCPATAPVGVYYTSTTLANPNLANTTSWVSQGTSNYNALEVDANKRLARGFQLRGVYTWSRNLDDGSAWNTSVSSNTPAFVSFPGNPSVDYGPAATNIGQAAAINGTWELPFGANHALSAPHSTTAQTIISGWNLSGIATLQDGFPFTPQLGYNPTGNGDSRNPARPQLNPTFNGQLYPKSPNQWFSPAAFAAPYPGTFGNASRDALNGPGLADLDVSLAKATPIRERLRTQFRVEYFNVLNRANFSTPNPVVFSNGPTPAKPSTAPALSPTAGVLTVTSTTSRQLQFALKFLF